ncbi:MAG: DUF2085 domain-containing protein [Aeromicrobium sp.]|nr:DUF2085 domain-containing protein [Aeromicrobium sp.]
MLDRFFIALGYGLCHQLPERSFFAAGYQLPVCARDTGIYLGFALGLLGLAVLARGSRPTELPRWPVLVLVALFVGAMAVDGVTSYAGLRTTTNDLRLLTGLLAGWALATITVPMVNSQIWRDGRAVRVPDGSRQVLWWLVLLAASFVVSRWMLPVLGVVYPLLVSAAIVVTFVAVNLVFVGLIPAFERRARRLRDIGPQVAIALVLGAIELAGASLLRMVAERFA